MEKKKDKDITETINKEINEVKDNMNPSFLFARLSKLKELAKDKNKKK